MNHEGFYELFKDYSQGDLDDDFVWACLHGEVEKVKYLLTSPELKIHANIHTESDNGIIVAFKQDNLEMIKYLLSSPDLKEHANIHANNEQPFRLAAHTDKVEIVQYLIFDYKIEKTESIEDFLIKTASKFSEQIQNMFVIRELNQQLEKELISDNIREKKLKL